ncbi:hypothetical protein OG455_22355 [Kitasatospora sp. NBC_01287]|uniref:hypothetical protein n=1 Tax=Kitasatospora sp. NBC_01287 TaxID=2903573 RepID=UPI00225A9880|nr:hypothetical protein [Kitasatospora sp. NBC_01287]MCX4748222.1 hypothetical protein [Kitasatospora sp. NBC_01287]
MPSTDEIRNEIKKTLSDPTPLYALAGAGELAYAKLREVPGQLEALAGDRRAAQETAAARLQEAQARLAEAQAKVVGTVTTLPTDLKSLQDRAQTFAFQQVGRAAGFAVKAKEVYDELAERGKGVVEKGFTDRPEAPVVTVERAESVPVDLEAVEEAEAEVEPVAESAAGPKPAKKAARTRKAPSAGK